MATLEFRDGEREIADYLADVLRRYEDRLYQITYDEAIELANRTMESDLVSKRMSSFVEGHFKNWTKVF